MCLASLTRKGCPSRMSASSTKEWRKSTSSTNPHKPQTNHYTSSIEWVAANIANFGGDPARIALWGQSAGAGSVTAYSYGYPEDPIVAALIADSSAPGIIDNDDYAHTNFTFLASLVGCDGLSSTEELSCMRNVSARKLQTALSTYSGSPSISFKPAIDNKTAFANWTQRAVEGKIAKIVSNSSTLDNYLQLTYLPSALNNRKQHQRRRRFRLIHPNRTRQIHTFQHNRINHCLPRRRRSQEPQPRKPHHLQVPIRRQLLQHLPAALVRSLS